MNMPISYNRQIQLLKQVDDELYQDSFNLTRDQQDKLRMLLQKFIVELTATYKENIFMDVK